MYLGKIVEIGAVDDIFGVPQHPYTQALLSAVPIPDPVKERARERILLTGDLPSPADPPSGCRFRSRCFRYTALSERKRDLCEQQEPPRERHGNSSEGHEAACHYAQVHTVL